MHPHRHTTLLLVAGLIALGIVTGVPPVETRELDVWRRAVPGDSVPRSIEEAERQGSRHPRSAEPVEYPRRNLRDMAAASTGERRCVDIGNANAARSGEVIGMNFRVYVDYWQRGAPPKLSWTAGHRVPVGEPTQWIIRARRLDAPAESWVFAGDVDTHRWSAAAMMKLMRIPWSRGTVIDFPSPGRWLLVASVARDWGCFVLELPSPSATP